MNARVRKLTDDFTPFEITFEFRSEEQYRAFNRAMNYYTSSIHRSNKVASHIIKQEDRDLVDLFKEIKTMWEHGALPKNESYGLAGVASLDTVDARRNFNGTPDVHDAYLKGIIAPNDVIMLRNRAYRVILEGEHLRLESLDKRDDKEPHRIDIRLDKEDMDLKQQP